MKTSKLGSALALLGLLLSGNAAFADAYIQTNHSLVEIAQSSIVLTDTSYAPDGSVSSKIPKTINGNQLTYSISRKYGNGDLQNAGYSVWFDVSNDGTNHTYLTLGGTVANNQPAPTDQPMIVDLSNQIEGCLVGINAGVYSKLSIATDPHLYYYPLVTCSK
jgi:hypothetical protein